MLKILNSNVIQSLQLSSLGLGKFVSYLFSLPTETIFFFELLVRLKKSVHFLLNPIDLCFWFP